MMHPIGVFLRIFHSANCGCILTLTVALSAAPSAIAIEFGLPVDCAVGRNCFVQQYPDMNSGEDAVDPFCGTATYDGHNGIDIRLLSLADMERGVPVIAMADGEVLRWRDGELDRLALSPDDVKSVETRECGNGVIINHGQGIEVQYCHMREGSISVSGGEIVKRGEKIGEIGASGLAQFPHVHVAVRKNGIPIDPMTGRPIGKGCIEHSSDSKPLFMEAASQLLGRGETQLLAFGLAGSIVEHSALVVSGPPPPLTRSSSAIVGWAWFANLQEDDRIIIKVIANSGNVFAEHTTEPINQNKASYLAYAGKRIAPSYGSYAITVGLVREGETVFTRTRHYKIR